MRYDTIVVGAGSGGAVVATRLSEDPQRSVLLLEAGPDYPDFERLPDELKYGYATATDVWTSDHNWDFVGKATDKAEPMLVPRGKVTGGTSAINGQVLMRGVPDDFDSWAAQGNDQWSFQQVLPYFRQLETDTDFGGDFHGRDGPIIARRYKRDEWLPFQTAFYNSCVAEGFPETADYNHPDSTGIGPFAFNNPNGIRISSALGYLEQARHRLNLTIRPRCTAHRIVFEGKRAVGVELESGDERFTVRGEEIVLSSGSIGSPHLLMLSGVGPADQLRELDVPVVADVPGVGQNLRDHPYLWVTWRTKEGFPMDGLAPRTQVGVRYTAPGSDLRNDMMIFPFSFAPDRIGRRGNRMAPMGVRMILFLGLAKGAGEVRLTSTDPNVQPSLDYRFLTDRSDIERLRDGVRLCLKLAEHADFADIIDSLIEPTEADLVSDEALEDWMMREIQTAHHITSTCKMGPASDATAVVDQFGRVHGLEGLRVADGSIMPDCVRANTNANIMMIGERIADFIRRGL